MNREEFFQMSHLQMSKITGRSRQRFSEYNSGKPIGEKTLREYAQKFGVTPGTFLDWLIEWREYDVFDPDAPYGRAYKDTEGLFFGDDKRLGSGEKPLMSEEVFMNLSIEDMCEMVQIPRNRMAGFVMGVMMDEKTIRRLSMAYKLTPGTFLDWFGKWKEVVKRQETIPKAG